jgi:hypothetical protein
MLLWMGEVGSSQASATVSYTYQNRNFNNLPHTYTHPPLGLLNASASLGFPAWPGKPTLSLVGTNLTNEFKPAVVFDTPNTGGILTIFNPPRAVVLSLSLSFGDS